MLAPEHLLADRDAKSRQQQTLPVQTSFCGIADGVNSPMSESLDRVLAVPVGPSRSWLPALLPGDGN
jgi:hypothetical protein